MLEYFRTHARHPQGDIIFAVKWGDYYTWYDTDPWERFPGEFYKTPKDFYLPHHPIPEWEEV